MPGRCAEMQELEHVHPETWNALESGDSCVNKSDSPFCSIGPDHGIEHEIRGMKVLGGITGITQSEATLLTLDRFFLIALELSRLVKDFEQVSSVTEKKQMNAKHHELSGSKHTRVFTNVAKMKEIILEHGDPFGDNSDEVANIMTKAVMPYQIKYDILNRDAVVRKRHETFVAERVIKAQPSIWSRMTKASLKLFKDSSKCIKTKVKDKIVELREERNLLARFIIVLRSRPDIDLKEALGKYEFSALPRSLFLPDGSIHLAYDKSKVMHAIEDLAKANRREDSQISTVSASGSSNVLPVASGQINANDTSKNKKSIIIFDGMALVNSIQKTECMKTYKDFAEVFLANLVQASHGYNEVRLVFDCYMQGSLKEKMWEKRTGGNEIQYHVDDRTVLSHIPLK